MGTMSFLLPNGLSLPANNEFARACLATGYDHTPVPTKVRVQGDRLIAQRELDESGYLRTPWLVDGIGQVMSATATLMERDLPYHFLVELARGKLNQVRSQTAEWRMIGLQTSPALDQSLSNATKMFAQAALAMGEGNPDQQAQLALRQSYQTASQLIHLYIDQLVQVRKQRQAKIQTPFACRLRTVPAPVHEPMLRQTFNAVCLPMTWRATEPKESTYNWTPVDQLVEWAHAAEMPIIAGPLVDFSASGLPDWLLTWNGDFGSLASFACDYIETAISRYRGRIRRWQLVAASNIADQLGLNDDDMLRLTARMAEAALQIDSELELVIGIAQPWGDYMTSEDHTYNPFVFADTLLRAGLPVAAFEMEWLMCAAPRGSYARDLLESSRLLDMFAVLGAPLQVSLAYPSKSSIDPLADPHQQLSGGGHWQAGFTPEAQADWASEFASLAVAKPYVSGVIWHQFSDAEPHLVPHGGLVDANGNIKPAMNRLRQVRDKYLG